MYYFLWAKYKYPYVFLFSILLLWEIIELLFTYIAINIFNPEILPDQGTDIIIGMIGGYLSLWLFVANKAKIHFLSKKYNFASLLSIRVFVAIAMALIWVRFYGYNYNISFLNSSHVNWFAFILWSTWLFITITIYNFIYFFTKKNMLSLVLTWIVYFPLLLSFEYIGHYVLNIRLVTNDGPLIFGLIHGSQTLKTFYLIAGILAIFLTNMLTIIFSYRLIVNPLSNLQDIQNKTC